MILFYIWNQQRDEKIRRSKWQLITDKADQRMWLRGAATVSPLMPSNAPKVDGGQQCWTIASHSLRGDPAHGRTEDVCLVERSQRSDFFSRIQPFPSAKLCCEKKPLLQPWKEQMMRWREADIFPTGSLLETGVEVTSPL